MWVCSKMFLCMKLPSKQKVLVMEYCSGGSLLSLLEAPENAFGLAEFEFFTVLQCVGEYAVASFPNICFSKNLIFFFIYIF